MDEFNEIEKLAQQAQENREESQKKEPDPENLSSNNSEESHTENNQPSTEMTPKIASPVASKPVWLSLMLPLSILLAAILISGTIFYTKFNSGSAQIGNQATADNQISTDNLKKWAKSVKLDMNAFNQCFASNQYQSKIQADVAYGTQVGVNGTPTFFINGEQVVGAQPFSVFAAAIDKAINSKTAPAKTISVNSNDYVLGDNNAPVTIVEFTDLQCPYCRQFWQNTLPQIKSQYVTTGKARLVYKSFPLTSIHPWAEPAAEAAECAGAQGKFWEMHDIIFRSQI